LKRAITNIRVGIHLYCVGGQAGIYVGITDSVVGVLGYCGELPATESNMSLNYGLIRAQ